MTMTMSLDAGKQLIPDMGPNFTLSTSWKPPHSKSVRLRVRLFRPTGFLAGEKTFVWWSRGAVISQPAEVWDKKASFPHFLAPSATAKSLI
jgi:hypothetical protein